MEFIQTDLVQLGYKPKSKRVLPTKKIHNPGGAKKVPKKIPKKVGKKKTVLKVKKKEKSLLAIKEKENKMMEALASIGGSEGKQTRVATGDPLGSAIGTPSGKNLRTFEGYGALLKRKVRSNYRLTNRNNDSSLKALVRIWINSDGQLTKMTMVEPSGNKGFNLQLTRAIKRSAPFPPPPPEILAMLRDGIDIYFSP